MTLEDYIVAAEARYRKSGERKGQAYWNTLDIMCPDLAIVLVDTVYDPFYNDAVLPDFLAAVSQRWEDRG